METMSWSMARAGGRAKKPVVWLVADIICQLSLRMAMATYYHVSMHISVHVLRIVFSAQCISVWAVGLASPPPHYLHLGADPTGGRHGEEGGRRGKRPRRERRRERERAYTRHAACDGAKPFRPAVRDEAQHHHGRYRRDPSQRPGQGLAGRQRRRLSVHERGIYSVRRSMCRQRFRNEMLWSGGKDRMERGRRRWYSPREMERRPSGYIKQLPASVPRHVSPAPKNLFSKSRARNKDRCSWLWRRHWAFVIGWTARGTPQRPFSPPGHSRLVREMAWD